MNIYIIKLYNLIILLLFFSFFMLRWLASTNAKDIGIQYILVGGLSGLIGSGLSIIIRLD